MIELNRELEGAGIVEGTKDWKRKLANGEPLTIVAYGDSWTYGSVAEGWYEAKAAKMDAELIHGSWVLQLRRYVQSINPQAVVLNRGRGGWTSGQGVDAFEQNVKAFAPDLLLLNFGINDWKRPSTLDEYRANMERLLNMTKEMGSDCLLWTSGPVSAASGETYGWSSPREDETYLAPFDSFNDTIRELASARNLTLADAERDIHAVWQAGEDISGWFYDAIHFTQPGHDLIFRCVKNALNVQS
jgi:lysophospholipase L1-like esterase